MLATWFAVVAEYDGEVRWKPSAMTARDRFVVFVARSPASLANSYQEVKAVVDDLQELMGGGRWTDPASADRTNWPRVANRSLIMQRWELATSERLAPWLAEAATFERERDAVRHEAGVIAGLAEVLLRDGTDESTETEYRDFVEKLQQAATRAMRAASEQDYDAASASLVHIHRACDQCHEIYR